MDYSARYRPSFSDDRHLGDPVRPSTGAVNLSSSYDPYGYNAYQSDYPYAHSYHSHKGRERRLEAQPVSSKAYRDPGRSTKLRTEYAVRPRSSTTSGADAPRPTIRTTAPSSGTRSIPSSRYGRSPSPLPSDAQRYRAPASSRRSHQHRHDYSTDYASDTGRLAPNSAAARRRMGHGAYPMYAPRTHSRYQATGGPSKAKGIDDYGAYSYTNPSEQFEKESMARKNTNAHWLRSHEHLDRLRPKEDLKNSTESRNHNALPMVPGTMMSQKGLDKCADTQHRYPCIMAMMTIILIKRIMIIVVTIVTGLVDTTIVGVGESTITENCGSTTLVIHKSPTRERALVLLSMILTYLRGLIITVLATQSESDSDASYSGEYVRKHRHEPSARRRHSGSDSSASSQEEYPRHLTVGKPRRRRSYSRHRAENRSPARISSQQGSASAHEDPDKSITSGSPSAKDPDAPPKGILKRPRDKFPEEPNPVREGVAPLKDAHKKGIPPEARWTKIDRRLVNPAALEASQERFEERPDYVIVLRVLSKEEIQAYAVKTHEIRDSRHKKYTQDRRRRIKEDRRRGRRDESSSDDEDDNNDDADYDDDDDDTQFAIEGTAPDKTSSPRATANPPSQPAPEPAGADGM
ncbi:hypothetical protein PHISP_07623 [Aspergillus sp. HF37]|nr:hypothetical protein PHISP_07623 [Aspergillus sp. HF37]